MPFLMEITRKKTSLSTVIFYYRQNIRKAQEDRGTVLLGSFAVSILLMGLLYKQNRIVSITFFVIILIKVRIC